MVLTAARKESSGRAESKTSAPTQQNVPFGQVMLMGKKDRERYGLGDRSTLDNPAPDLFLWAVSPNVFRGVNEDGVRATSQYGLVCQAGSEYFDIDPVTYFGSRLPGFFNGKVIGSGAPDERLFRRDPLRENINPLRSHPVNGELFASVLRLPIESLIFPQELNSLGIRPQPGMIYIRAKRSLLDILGDDETDSRYLGGLYTGEALFTVTSRSRINALRRGKGEFEFQFLRTVAEDESFDDQYYSYEHLSLDNSSNAFWDDWEEKELSGNVPFACLTNPQNGSVLPLKLGYLYDLERAYGMRYVHSDSEELVKRGEIVLAFPLRLDVSVFTEMRATLTSYVERIFPLDLYGADHPQRKSAVDFLLSLTASGGDGPVNIEIPRGPLKDHLPTHPPIAFDSWVSSPNWMHIQLVLLAHTIGGDRWENVLKLIQGHGTTTLSFL